MATRQLTLTIPDSLAVRLDAYPGNLKLSAFFQEKLTEFLDAEDAKTTAALKEQQILDIKAVGLLVKGEHAAAYEGGRQAGRAWAWEQTDEQLVKAHAAASLYPFPPELGRNDLLPKSLLANDPRLKAYIPAMLGAEVMKNLAATPEPVFMLPSARKDEALIWVYGWNTGLDEVFDEKRESEGLADARPKSVPKSKRGGPKRPPST
jgi:hypothetical protein